MRLRPPRGAYAEILAHENELKTATNTWQSWHKLNRLWKLADLFDREVMGDLQPLARELKDLLDRLWASTGTIKGEHRKDLVAALQGMQARPPGIALELQQPGPPQNHVNGVEQRGTLWRPKP